MSVEEDSRQEWTFTLYDFDNNGKVTREDITSLLHTIYEVVDSSVNHSPTSSKTLRVKLTVAPDGSQAKKGILLNHPDLQSTRPRAETKPAEELRSWEKKQRAPLRTLWARQVLEFSIGCVLEGRFPVHLSSIRHGIRAVPAISHTETSDGHVGMSTRHVGMSTRGGTKATATVTPISGRPGCLKGSRVTAVWSSLAATTTAWMRTLRGETTT